MDGETVRRVLRRPGAQGSKVSEFEGRRRGHQWPHSGQVVVSKGWWAAQVIHYNTIPSMPSDLDLVAQAMASSGPRSSSDPPANARQQPTATSNGLHQPAPNASTPGSALPPDITAALSSLSPMDLASLQPLLAALEASGADDDANMDIADLLRQMDQANGVADALESRLDGLLGALGRAQAELEAETAGGDGEAMADKEKRAFGGESHGQGQGQEQEKEQDRDHDMDDRTGGEQREGA